MTEIAAPARDPSLVVIGGSAGALRSLLEILASLPADFPGVVLITLHTAEGAVGLSTVLETHCRMPVREARDGERLPAGVVLTASSTSHLMLRDGHIWLHKGPKENRHRPAIDPLFRSASRFYPTRTIGVLLSGLSDDGVAGLIRVQKRGGVTIVQDPGEALYPQLPRAALAQMTPDLVLPASKIGEALKKPPAPRESHVEEGNPYLEVQSGGAPLEVPDSPPEPFSCPTCHGTLWRAQEGDSRSTAVVLATSSP